MTKGFYSIMLAQFLSSLADNALLIAAIALLTTLRAGMDDTAPETVLCSELRHLRCLGRHLR